MNLFKKTSLLTISIAVLLLFGMSSFAASPSAGSPGQATLVTVVEGKVMCFDYPEELIPAITKGEIRTGKFIERVNDSSGWVLVKGKRKLGYIPYNLRYQIYEQLQSGVQVLLQKNDRRQYKTEWDIISVGILAKQGNEFIKGELSTVAPREVAQLTKIADSMKEEIKTEEAPAAKEAKEEAVNEVLDEEDISLEEVLEEEIEEEVVEEEVVEEEVVEEEVVEEEVVEEEVVEEEVVEEEVVEEEVVEEEVEPDPIDAGNTGGNGEVVYEGGFGFDPDIDQVGLGTGAEAGDGAGAGDDNADAQLNEDTGGGGDGGGGGGGTTPTYYWVNPTTGSDQTGAALDGTNYGSSTYPWQTIEYAVNNMDENVSTTINLVEGTYDNSAPGIENFPIVISSKTHAVTITVAGNATIDAKNSSARVFTISNNTGIITLQAVGENKFLTIQNGENSDLNCGGGIFASGNTDLRLTKCNIASNSTSDALASAGGGGIRIYGCTSVTLSKCKIHNNSAIGAGFPQGGGGVSIYNTPVSFSNCLFYENQSYISGGAIYAFGWDGSLMNCTFADDDSMMASSEEIYLTNDSDPTITNSIFYITTALTYAIWTADTTSIPIITYCSFYNSAPGNNTLYRFDAPGNTGDITGWGWGTTATCINPEVDPNFENSALDDYRLQATSPCADQGTPAGMPGDDINDIARSSPPDMGCYEIGDTYSDPPITGKIYDSVTGATISSPTVAIYRDGSTTYLSRTTSNPYTFNVTPGKYYIAVIKNGYGFPSQIVGTVVTGDHGDTFTAEEDPLTIDIPVDPDGWLYVEKSANKKRVSAGEIVTYNVKIQNKHWYQAVSNVELVDEIVNGFKYVKGSAYISTSQQSDPVISGRKAVFSVGTVPKNSTVNLSYQVRVGTGIADGRYRAAAHTRKSTTEERNSNISYVTVEVMEDPLFTKGTIIGKVFYDYNGNGIQDASPLVSGETKPSLAFLGKQNREDKQGGLQYESGIAGIRIATEYGVVVETDSDGKYHIKDVPEGNHLLKVDPSTLPPGAEFTTDNPYFVKITEGLLAKVNFGINLEEVTSPLDLSQVPEETSDKSKQGGSSLRSEQFFIVMLAEGTVRNLSTSGNIDMVDKDDRFDDGVRVDGRIALYLKGKVLGKFLVTASLDSERRPKGRYDSKRLFRNLDPDKYYPVYGDASKVDYAGIDTQDIAYVLIEWDESFAKWGSFHTDFPMYKRTLSGGYINYQSVGKTKFDDPWTIVKGFGAISRQKAAHDEFVGTGGSLYYLRHDDVIEGSEKIRVEVRNRISKVTISSFPLAEEKDYEIDYDRGRILLRKPLNSIQQAYSRSIVSNDILMGERVSLVVDYEYLSDSLSNEAFGIRGSQQIGHYVRVGGVYVQEQREGDPYKLAGGDVTLKLNKDTQVNASYSRSEETMLGAAASFDGGLTFSEQGRDYSLGKSGSAVSIDGRTKLFDNTDIFLSYSRQDPFYSTTSSISSQGTQKYIANITSRFTEHLAVGIGHVTQKILEGTLAGSTLGARDIHTTTGILDYRRGKWDLRAEYQHQEVDHPTSTFTYFGTMSLLENDFIAARVGYKLFDWLHPYIRGQVTVNGDANDQGTLGADINLWDKTQINIAETVGTLGNSTALGVTTKITEDTDAYANLEVGNHMQLGRYTKTTYGQSSQFDSSSKAYVEEDYSSYRENIVRGSILGYDKKITDTMALGLTYERSNVKNNVQVIDRDSGSVTLTYLNTDSLPIGQEAKGFSKVEVRNDRGLTEVRQWVMENDMLWRVTEGLTLSARGNWGWTSDLDSNTDEAKFYELGTGFSLRPVTWDRLNILGKYSYLTDLPPDSQLDFIEDIESRKHVYAIEGAFDLFRYLQLVGKFAYRDMKEKVGPRDWMDSDTYLYIARTNFHIMNSEAEKPFLLRGWDLGVEYRVLSNDQIEDTKEGFLVELDKDIGNYLRLGVGYNFTDYDDDLRNEDEWDSEGWFLRVNGKY